MGKLIRLRESDEAIARGLGMTVEAYRERKAFLLRQYMEFKVAQRASRRNIPS